MAIVVRNASKQFGSATALDNLSLTVTQGSIYGLLGASGCGKTTLLSCVVGLRSLDSGDAIVFGSRPGKSGSGIPGPVVGYMPQDVALYPLFTIREILAYYGKIYGMRPKDIGNRTEFLTKFLQLPDTNSRIDTLSGGEERRVSFAVAMIHSPPLLILDEPTVGLDPLLRESIWKHLSELVARETVTIVITTHYIEEARFCDMVGIMRRGQILAEENPDSLLFRYNSNSLESVVLQLCKENEVPQKAVKNDSMSPKTPSFTYNSFPVHKIWEHDIDEFTGVELKGMRKLSWKDSKCDHLWLKSKEGKQNTKLRLAGIAKKLKSHWDISCALAKKNFIVHTRHPVAVGAQLLLPLLQTILYNLIIGRDPVQQDFGYYSDDWNTLRNGSSYQGTLFEYCKTEYKVGANKTCFPDEMNAICGFLKQFDPGDINWVPQESYKNALGSVQLGNTVGFLEIPKNFTAYLHERVLHRNFAEDDIVDKSSLKISMDLTDSLSRAWLSDKLLQNFAKFAVKLAHDCGQDPRLVDIPLKYNAIFGKLNDNAGFNKFVQPALIIGLMYILANLPGVVLVMEKRLGVTDRGTVAGIKFGHIVVGSFLCDTVIILAQMTILFTVLPFCYGMKSEGSWALCVALVFCLSMAGLCSGLFWGSLYNYEMDIIMTNLFINSIMTISGGGFWPLDSVVGWYRIVCLCLPISIPIISLRAIMFRGWGLEHPQVLQGFITCFGWIFTFLSISTIVNNRKK